jgi:hypothetical protein
MYGCMPDSKLEEGVVVSWPFLVQNIDSDNHVVAVARFQRCDRREARSASLQLCCVAYVVDGDHVGL